MSVGNAAFAAPAGLKSAGRPATAWWGRTTTMLAFMALSTLPLWFAATPPLTDFVGHLARYHVALDIGHNPALARNWSYDWAIAGNLGVDLLIMPLARLLGLETAGWLIAAALPPLMIWGIFRAARAVHGEVPPSAIACLPFALALPYQYGFVNFWLASGLAFHAFASWVELEGRERLRAALFVPAAIAIWLCHAYGWGVLGILVGGYELARSERRLPALTKAALRAWPLLPVLLVMAVWRSGVEGAETAGWFDLPWKLRAAMFTLRDQWQLLDVATLSAAALLVYDGLRHPRTRLDARFGIPALLLFGALLALPLKLFGSGYADSRICPLLFIAALLSVRPPADPSGKARWVPVGFAALFAVRIGVSAIGYAEYDSTYKAHLEAVEHIERGSSVAVMIATPCVAPWRLERLEHLGSMAVLRRDTFVNSQWDVPGAELLRPKHALGTDFNADPSQFVRDPHCSDDLRPALAAKLARLPHGVFDYVWAIDFGPEPVRAGGALVPVYQGPNSTLYRIAG